jgi:enoyl-CoA hydratase/carnithine racemase
MGYQQIQFEIESGVAHLTLNRPDAMNAVTPRMVEEIDDAISEAESDEEVRVLTLTGAGRAFCAGVDLGFARGAVSGGDVGRFFDFAQRLGTVLRRLERIERPTVCVLNGLAAAGGLELALCCDLIFAAETAKVGDAHANYGLVPGAGGSVRLVRRVGPGRAKELMFTGAFVPVTELQGSGLINRVVPDDQLDAVVSQLCDNLGAKSPLGLARMKRLVDDCVDESLEAALAHERAVMQAHAYSADMAEGMTAFAEKRSPIFKGR